MQYGICGKRYACHVRVTASGGIYRVVSLVCELIQGVVSGFCFVRAGRVRERIPADSKGDPGM